jgi:Tfp pilus assembly protein PilX
VKETRHVRGRAQHGATLVVGMILLALVSMLGLAGAAAAHIELQVAQNERFRENAALAASAGIEYAIGRIVTTPDPATVPATFAGTMPDSPDRYSVVMRLAGFELALPQDAGSHSAGAHFEIVSTGRSGRSVDRQRATVMLVMDSADAVPAPCFPQTARCLRTGDLVRTSWQRVPAQ